MAWLIKLDDGVVVDTDDWTLADLIEIEKETGTPWSTANPLREAQVARAFIRCAMRKESRDPREVDGWTLKRLKSVFDYRSDTEEEQGAASEEEVPLDGSTAPESSSGARGGSSGRQKRLAVSA